MKQGNKKLIAAVLLTLTSISLIVTVSYAWMTISGQPALTGVEISISGSETIKLACDLTREVDGKVVHYPGAFLDTFDVSAYPSYDYLNRVGGLLPVSTADGLHWFLPPQDMDRNKTYTLEDYQMDQTLSFANRTGAEVAEDPSGQYIYLDFWIVSPLDDCNVRVSIGSEQEGSYVMSLPTAVWDASRGQYVLDMDSMQAANSVRVGFLVNEDEDEAAYEVYRNSMVYQSKYGILKGCYQEAGIASDADRTYQFTIYEPNADAHDPHSASYVQTENGLVYRPVENGQYVQTQPIGFLAGKPVLKNISQILAVQKTSYWKYGAAERTLIEEIFSAVMGKETLGSLSDQEIIKKFYFEHLNGQFSNYIVRGNFYSDIRELYFACLDQATTTETLTKVEEANVTQDAVIVHLKKDEPQRIRMYVWLEGQDVDCVREAALETFTIGLELAGSTVD